MNARHRHSPWSMVGDRSVLSAAAVHHAMARHRMMLWKATRALSSLLLVALASAAAISVHAGWERQGATPEQLKKDQSQCDVRARSDAEFGRFDPSGPSTRPGATLRGANNMQREARSFDLCMRERGYEWVDAKGAAKKSAGEAPAQDTDGSKR